MIRTSLQRTGGLWSAFEVGLNVGRQNGKGSVLEARELIGLFVLHEPLIIHSAHEFKTSFEHFMRMVSLVESTPLFDSKVARIRRGAGEQAIELVSGARLRFVARSGGASGRGFSAPCVVIDEAQEMTEAMLGAMMPTLSAQENPQVWYTGSAEHAKSRAWHAVRQRAEAGKSPRLFYAGWNNDADVDPFDEEAVQRANPAYGIRIDPEFVKAERDAMPATEFARERLGVPEPLAGTLNVGPITLETWASLIDADSRPDPTQCRLAMDTNADRTWFTLCLAGRRPDGLIHGEITKARNDLAESVRLAAEVAAKLNAAVTVTDAALGTELERAGATVDLMKPAEFAAATSALIDATRGEAPKLRHMDEPALKRALELAKTKPYGDGGIVWSRRSTTGDISPITALTMAFGRLVATDAREFAGGFASLDDWLTDDD